MKRTIGATFLTISMLAASSNFAAAQSAEHVAYAGNAAAPASTSLTQGEVRKIDREAKKLTLRHGPIQNLEMPGMTMVFRVQDPAVLDSVKVGDKVQFAAEKIDDAITVTRIEALN